MKDWVLGGQFLSGGGASPASHLGWLHIKEVGSQDVDVGIQAEGSGGLSLPCLPHPIARGRWVGVKGAVKLLALCYLFLSDFKMV